MKEVWKFTYDYKGNSFDLKVYKKDDGYSLKIFFENKMIEKLTCVISEENAQTWKSTQDEPVYTPLVKNAMKWIREDWKREVDINNYSKPSR